MGEFWGRILNVLTYGALGLYAIWPNFFVLIAAIIFGVVNAAYEIYKTVQAWRIWKSQVK